MTEQEKQNLLNILSKAKIYITEFKKAAPVGEAIGIANREAHIESYYRKMGIDLESAKKVPNKANSGNPNMFVT